MKEVKKAVADKIAAEEIEAKKTVRKTARKAKEVKEEAVALAKEAVADKIAAEEIEAKKTVKESGEDRKRSSRSCRPE